MFLLSLKVNLDNLWVSMSGWWNNCLALMRWGSYLKLWFLNSMSRILAWSLIVKLIPGELHKTSLMRIHHWFNKTFTEPVLTQYHVTIYMASPRQNDFKNVFMFHETNEPCRKLIVVVQMLSWGLQDGNHHSCTLLGNFVCVVIQ